MNKDKNDNPGASHQTKQPGQECGDVRQSQDSYDFALDKDFVTNLVTKECDQYLLEFLKLATEYQLQHGSWSYKAFKGKYEHRYFKNIVWKLQKLGKVARIEPRSRPAFYRAVGIDLSSNHNFVTNDRMGDRQAFIDQLFKIEGSKQPAIHDVRLVSYATGLHGAAAGKGFPMNDVSKDITLVDWHIDAWRSIKITVHNTDSFTTLFASSNRPIICNPLDVANWFITLGRLQEKMLALTGIDIPEPSLWQVRALHFNQDMYSGIDLPAGLVICTRDIYDNLIRVYTKKLPDEPETMVRVEREETSKDSKPLWQKASGLLNVSVVSP